MVDQTGDVFAKRYGEVLLVRAGEQGRKRRSTTLSAQRLPGRTVGHPRRRRAGRGERRHRRAAQRSALLVDERHRQGGAEHRETRTFGGIEMIRQATGQAVVDESGPLQRQRRGPARRLRVRRPSRPVSNSWTPTADAG